jgi:hypothetical protein
MAPLLVGGGSVRVSIGQTARGLWQSLGKGSKFTCFTSTKLLALLVQQVILTSAAEKPRRGILGLFFFCAGSFGCCSVLSSYYWYKSTKTDAEVAAKSRDVVCMVFFVLSWLFWMLLVWTTITGTQFTCFTSTKVQILTPVEPAHVDAARVGYTITGTQFTCFTSTKVQRLTP